MEREVKEEYLVFISLAMIISPADTGKDEITHYYEAWGIIYTYNEFHLRGFSVTLSNYLNPWPSSRTKFTIRNVKYYTN